MIMATKKELVQAIAPADDTPDALKALAAGIGEKYVTVYDAVRDAIGKEKGSLSADFLTLGRECLKAAHGDFDKAHVFFASSTAGAEQGMRTRYKQAHSLAKLPPLAEVLPAWQPAKSVISKAIEKRKDLTNEKTFATFTDVRNAVKTERGTKSRDEASTEPGKPDVAALKVSDQLSATLRALVTAIAVLKDATKEDAAAAILMPVVAEIERISKGEQAAPETDKAAKKEALKRGGRRA
jgi:hypothetical protein